MATTGTTAITGATAITGVTTGTTTGGTPIHSAIGILAGGDGPTGAIALGGAGGKAGSNSVIVI